MSYSDFKTIYCAVFAICGVVLLGVITAINPWITLGLFGAFFVIGGAYIIHREGWLAALTDTETR